jgi:hypothetical protein
MDDKEKNKVIIVLFFLLIISMCVGISLTYHLEIKTIYIIQKHQIIENNTIVFLIEAGLACNEKDTTLCNTDTQFYTISQENYNRLNTGFCEVKLNKNEIIAFNHLHTKCDYTYD